MISNQFKKTKKYCAILILILIVVFRLSFHNQAPSNRASESYLSIRIRRPDEGNSYYHFSYVSGPGVALADRYRTNLPPKALTFPSNGNWDARGLIFFI
jgi:hypothetical protein